MKFKVGDKVRSLDMDYDLKDRRGEIVKIEATLAMVRFSTEDELELLKRPIKGEK